VFFSCGCLIGATNVPERHHPRKTTFGAALATNISGFSPRRTWPADLLELTKITVMATLLTLSCPRLPAYGFEMFRSRLRDGLYNLMFAQLFVAVPR